MTEKPQISDTETVTEGSRKWRPSLKSFSIKSLHWRSLPQPVQWVLLGLGFLFVWYAVLGTLLAGIKVDTSLRANRELLPAGGSVAVGMLGTIVESQIEGRSAFAANDPFFYPTAFARRTSAFQSQIIATSLAVSETLAISHSSPDLDVAVRALSVSPQQWWVSAHWPFLTLPAERHYQVAIGALGTFNHHLAANRASQTPVRAGELGDGSRAVLQALQRQLSAEAEEGDRILRGLEKRSPAIQLARARGTAYAAAMVLRGVQEDNADAVRASGQAIRWGEARDALDQAAAYDPLFASGRELRTIGYSLLIANNAIRVILSGE